MLRATLEEARGGGDVKKADVGAEGRASEVNDKTNCEKREAGTAAAGEDEDRVKMETDQMEDDADAKATVDNSDADEKIDPVS